MNSIKEKLTEKLPVLVTLLIALQVLTFVYVAGSKSQVEQSPLHGYGYSSWATFTGSVETTVEKTELQKITEAVIEEKKLEEEEVTTPTVEVKKDVVVETTENKQKNSEETTKVESVKPVKTTPVTKIEEKIEVKTVVDTPKKEEVKVEKVSEVKHTPTVIKTDKVDNTTPKVEKHKTEVKPVVKTETTKEVMLAPEKTIVVNGEVVVRSGNEDYRDLEEERMIEDILSSGQSQRITSYEMLEVVDKRTGPTIRYVEDEAPIVGDRDLAEEAMLDAVLNAGL